VSEVLYKRVGRRYVPFATPDKGSFDTAAVFGFYLVELYPGGKTIRPVVPTTAEVDAALQVVEKDILADIIDFKAKRGGVLSYADIARAVTAKVKTMCESLRASAP